MRAINIGMIGTVYLGVDDPKGLAGFIKSGVFIFETPANDILRKSSNFSTNWALPTRSGMKKDKGKFPLLDMTSYSSAPPA